MTALGKWPGCHQGGCQVSPRLSQVPANIPNARGPCVRTAEPREQGGKLQQAGTVEHRARDVTAADDSRASAQRVSEPADRARGASSPGIITAP